MSYPRTHAVSSRLDSPGVRYLWRGGSHATIPALREEAVRDVCVELGVSPREVHVQEAKTVDGHLRIFAGWWPS